MVNPEIFKSYDVRGIFPSDLNKEIAFQIGKAFIRHTEAQSVIIGYDARLSSLELFNALARGLFAQGAKITNIGLIPTEVLYFALAQSSPIDGFDGGIMITASHNPKEYNGFKMMKRKGNNIEWIRGRDLKKNFKEEMFDENSNLSLTQQDILPQYLDFTFSFFGGMGNKKLFKIVVDASNGVMGQVIEKMKPRLPLKIIDLNFKPDGNFPNHSPNPLDQGASSQIAEKIKKERADFGIIFDGDADRIFLVDENGKMVSADIVLLLLAKHFLQKNPGKAVAYNLICSRAVPKFIEKWGGKPIRTQVGFVNVRQALIDHLGIIGGELSAHYCFADYFYMDSGMMAFLSLLQIIGQDGRKVSEIIKDLAIYPPIIQMNFKVKNVFPVIKKLKEKYADGKQDFLDGLTVEYDDWWFNVRPSNTEPLLKVTIEADSEQLREEKKKELLNLIPG